MTKLYEQNKITRLGGWNYLNVYSNYFKKTAIIVLIGLFCSLAVNAQKLDANIKTSKKVMDDFMDKRFGMFIHWGPVTLRGTEIGWSRGHEVATDDYDNLYKEFNPILFNADEWVKTAKEAGMKYITITSKHHDGFCLWPSAFTEYDIMASPFKKDIVGELAKACKKYDIKFCIYFTVLDWHDKNYPIHNDGAKELDSNGNMDKFILTMKNQLKELVVNYDPYMLWFDGQWETPWTDAMGVDMYHYLKGLKKDLIINNRLGKEMSGVSNNLVDYGKMVGDFDTPEQKIGNINMDFPWESCITICNQWAWKSNDKMKTLKECIQTLVKTVGGNGNLLFNVGPMMDGRIEARQTERLKEMGNWLTKYGESIYGTKGGPYKPNNTYATTRKGNLIYLHIFERNSDKLILPVLADAKIKKAYFLNANAVSFAQNKDFGVLINLPKVLPDAVSSVIVLELDTNSEKLVVINN
jgi:alpha-L-fucosidase